MRNCTNTADICILPFRGVNDAKGWTSLTAKFLAILLFVFIALAPQARAQYFSVGIETFDTVPVTDLTEARSNFSCAPSTTGSTTGTFDLGNAGVYRLLPATGSLSGWREPNGTDDGTAPPGVVAPSGNYLVINSFAAVQPTCDTDGILADTNGNGRPGELACTTFPSVPVGEYAGSAFLAEATNTDPGTSRYSFFITHSGGTVVNTPVTNLSLGDRAWQYNELNFTTTSAGPVEVCLIQTSNLSLGADIHLDQIALYATCDGGGNSALCPNAPVAQPDSLMSATIEAVTISPLTNDTDDDGNATLVPSSVVLTGVGAPMGSVLSADGKTLEVPNEGTWSVAANGDITFTPLQGFASDPTPAPYTVDDDTGLTSNPASLSIDFGDAPAATDDTLTSATIEPVTISPLGNDTDADGMLDPTTVVLTGVGAPTDATLSADGKTLTVPGEGVWTVAANGDITFTPEDGFAGDPTPAPYTVDDDDGNTSNPATLTVDYGDRPVAVDDSITSGSIGAVTFDPLGNDTDADGSLDPTTVVLTLTDAPADATLSPDGKTLTVPGEGVWTVAANGEITFTPVADFTGDPTPVSYTVDDTDGNTSNEATVTVEYDVVPEVMNDTLTSATIEPVTINPLSNDMDPDGTLVPGSVVLTGAGAPADATLSGDGKTLTVPGEGVWTVAANGEITFTPEDGFAGDPTPAAYTVDDNEGNTSDPATVSIDYGDAPVATDDTLTSATIEPVTISPLGNDTDADGMLDPATVVLTGDGAPTDATLSADGKTLTVPGEGVWTVAANGDITFTPEDGFVGDPTPAPYTVDDDDGNTSNPATLTIDYGDAPVAVDDSIPSGTIGPVTFDPTGNDTDADGSLDPTTVVLTLTDAPADATLSPDGKTLTVPGEGVWEVDPVSGEIRFTPEDGFTDNPTPAAYTVSDDDGNTSNEAKITIGFGDGPVASDDMVVSGLIQPVTIDPLGNDADADGTLDPTSVVLAGVGAPAGSTLSPDGKTLTVPGEGEWTVDPVSGAITFTPEEGFAGDPTPAPYTVDDNDGNTSNQATVSIDYGDVPVATDDVVASGLIAPVAVDVLGNDSDPDGTADPATVVLTGTGAPADATLSADGKTLTVPGEGEWSVDPVSGAITFTPEDGFAGDPTPAAYVVNDNDGNTSNEATVSIDYGDVPVATDDIATSDVPGPVTLNPLGNDTDTDGTLDPTTVALSTSGAPAGASLSPDGKTLTVPGEGVWTVDPVTGEITFTPEEGFVSDPTPATYTVADNDGNVSNPATMSVVYGEPPVATNDTVEATEPGPVSINPLANDDGDDPLDPTSVVLTGTGATDGAVLSANGKVLTVPGEGEWSVNPTTGLVTFTPEAGFSGTPTPAAYTVADSAGRVSNEAFLSVMVQPPLEIIATADGPIALDGSNGGTSSVSVLDNDTLDGSPITDPSLVTITSVSVPSLASGAITINPDGTVTVAEGTTPGTYTLVYQICEDANPTNCATAEVELVIVDTGTGLINEIEEDLESILTEDLANTLTQQSNQISGYSADALDRLRGREGGAQCMAAVNLEARNILFDVDRAVIKPEGHRALDEIALILQGCPASSFEIAGHTDSDASDAYNIDLSQRRVTAVLHALTRRGVDTSGYIARGYGEREPIASNATEEGKAQNRRVEFRLLDGVESYHGPCDDGFSLIRELDARTTSAGSNVNGQFVRDHHDCITDRRDVFEGTLSYLDTETGQTQSAINLSYRREQYRGGDSVFGYFVGLYGTRSDVTRLANGEISGVGLNAGIYGANRLDSDLFVDYYLGAAAGRHTFDLAFDRGIGTIGATGDYNYLAGFAGAALSGHVELGNTTVTPRVGFDYVYTPGADVDVVAELSGLSEVGSLELDSLSGGRIFAEVRTDHLVQDGQANVWFNPRIACYQSLGALDGACGIGGSIGIESVDEADGLTYALELDGEWGEGYTQGSLSVRATRDIGLGSLSGDAGVSRNGGATLGGAYEIQF